MKILNSKDKVLEMIICRGSRETEAFHQICQLVYKIPALIRIQESLMFFGPTTKKPSSKVDFFRFCKCK